MLLSMKAWRLLGEGWHATSHKIASQIQKVVLGEHSAALCSCQMTRENAGSSGCSSNFEDYEESRI